MIYENEFADAGNVDVKNRMLLAMLLQAYLASLLQQQTLVLQNLDRVQ